MMFNLIYNIFVVVNSVKFFRQTVNARGLGEEQMHEGLDHFPSVVVVPDSAPGICAKTNAGEDTLIGPTQVVTTINSVSHGFGPVKNVNWGITIQQELITEFRKYKKERLPSIV